MKQTTDGIKALWSILVILTVLAWAIATMTGDDTMLLIMGVVDALATVAIIRHRYKTGE